MDEDLNGLTREQLIEVKRLRAGIRTHRDSSGHDLCWYHPDPLEAPAGTSGAQGRVPDCPVHEGCIRYRQSLDAQLPDAPRTTAEFDK